MPYVYLELRAHSTPTGIRWQLAATPTGTDFPLSISRHNTALCHALWRWRDIYFEAPEEAFVP